MPEVKHCRIFDNRGKPNIEILGPVPKGTIVYVASGAPAYVFDAGGRFVQWTPDRGEARKYTERWEAFGDGTNLSVAEAIIFLQKTGTN